MNALLTIKDLSVRYGDIPVLHGISLEVRPGEVVALIGPNGAGKTTTLRAVSGLTPPCGGSILFEGRDITRMAPHQIVRAGVIHVPEGRGIFTNLSVRENLELAASARRSGRKVRRCGAAAPGCDAVLAGAGARPTSEAWERVFRLFPRLKERLDQPGATLSGGEQQMLALGRALMAGGRLLLLDEPSMGLAPLLVGQIFDVLSELKSAGATILLVEQNAYQALGVADRAYVLESGRIVLEGPAPALRDSAEVKRAYLGG